MNKAQKVEKKQNQSRTELVRQCKATKTKRKKCQEAPSLWQKNYEEICHQQKD